VLDRVLRDVDACHARARHHLHQLVQQKTLADTHVQDGSARLEIVVPGHGFGDRPPTAIVPIAPIPVLALAVPIVAPELNRHFGDGRLVVLGDSLYIIAACGRMHAC
jgi:hypothetical protein